jgi:hypothetical protein
MNKVGHKEDEGVLSYSELEPKKSHSNCTGVVVQGVFGVLVHSGDYVLIDEMVARIVTVGDKQVKINEFPRVVEDASKGWEPIKEDYQRLNQEVYQSRYLMSVPVESISGLALVRKHEQLIHQSADKFGMTNVFVLRFRESLILEKYEPVGAKKCLPFPSLYPAMNMKTCATSQIAASLENIKVCLYKMFVKHDMASQGPYGFCLKLLYTSNWFWAYMKHHFLHHNKLVVEELNVERKKGSIRYHFTLEALRLKEDFEGLRLGADRQFDSFRDRVGKFAGIVAQTPPP